MPPLESSSECDSNVDSEVSSHSLHYQTGWLLYLLLPYLSQIVIRPPVTVPIRFVHIRSYFFFFFFSLLHPCIPQGDDVTVGSRALN